MLDGRGGSFLVDATAEGTMALDVSRNIVESLVTDAGTYFVQDVGTNHDLRLSADGDVEQSRQVEQFDSELGFAKSRPQQLTQWNERIYFVVDDPQGLAGVQVWSTDGTGTGTIMETSFGPEQIGSSPASLFVYNDSLYFTADDGSHGRELWQLSSDAEALKGDVNRDRNVDDLDIDAVYAAIRDGDSDAKFDLNEDALVDANDVEFLVEVVLGTCMGDTNLDGKVDFADFLTQANAFDADKAVGWSGGRIQRRSRCQLPGFLDNRQQLRLWSFRRMSDSRTAFSAIRWMPKARVWKSVEQILR